ncbi:MAG: UMP kinase [Candidatus Paceibacterota bacterium]|jgi:uridylate kinase
MADKNMIVISLGGSLIVPQEVDKEFLKGFKALIVKWVKKGKRFFIVTGGGKTTRNYQQAAREMGINDKTALDHIGIYTTYVNAELIRNLFGKLACSEIVKDYSKKIKGNPKIIVAPGWKPGCSTDFDAVFAAKIYKAKRVINLSNIDLLYDKDPKVYSDATPIELISFDKLMKITGKVWHPGANMPFDPKASQLAKKHSLEVIIAAGKDLANLNDLIAEKPFKGTVVSNEF